MKLSTLATALAMAVLPPCAHAHGQPKAQHGGVVAMANDLSFELVAQGPNTTLYLFDHDKPLEAKSFSGKLTRLSGSQKTEVELKPAGANRLEAAVSVSKGDKVVATLTSGDKKSHTVRFSLK
jgi:hypothetical protein